MKPSYSEQILPVPWSYVISRFQCIIHYIDYHIIYHNTSHHISYHISYHTLSYSCAREVAKQEIRGYRLRRLLLLERLETLPSGTNTHRTR